MLFGTRRKLKKNLEAEAGFEPTSTALQAAV